MGRKVFLSMLGTGVYSPCTYKYQGHEANPTRFIQRATLQLIGAKSWNKNDRMMILLTGKARKLNWAVKGNKREVRREIRGEVRKETIDYIGLKTELENLRLPCPIGNINIPEGKNHEEMWKIFDIIYDKLNDGDELYIDLTHGFRYLPMLIVLVNYAKFLKNVQIKSMTYGNFEAQEKGITPVVDLLPIASLQDWTTAAADYINNGYTKHLKDLDRKNKFVKKLCDVTLERQTCRGIDIDNGRNVKKLLELKTDAEKPLIARLYKKIQEEEQKRQEESVNSCLTAASWCYDNALYQQAITILEEGLVTFVYKKCKDITDNRNLVESALNIQIRNIPEDKWNLGEKKPEDKEVYKNIVRKLLANPLFIKKDGHNNALIKLCSKIKKTRNDYNHAGFRPNAIRPNNIITKIQEYIDSTEEIIKTFDL